MGSRVRAVDEATLAARRLQAQLGMELRDARLMRGLRQSDVASAVATSHATISRVELGLAGDLSIAAAARHGAIVGLRLHVRFYPAAGGLRDAAQLNLLRRFRARVGDRWRWQLEVPLPIPGDLRAFDALLTRPATSIAVEAITRLRDAQAQLRQASLKQRDGAVPRLVILIGATPHNRETLATAADVLATAFPIGTRATLRALQAGEDPGENGIVLL